MYLVYLKLIYIMLYIFVIYSTNINELNICYRPLIEYGFQYNFNNNLCPFKHVSKSPTRQHKH